MKKTEGQKKLEKLLVLFEKQNGLCWVCEFPMVKPLKAHRGPFKGPSKWEANLDHVREGGKGGKCLAKKAAHAGCNSARHHYGLDHLKVQRYIKGVKTKFSDKNFVSSIFSLTENTSSPTMEKFND